MKNDIQCGYTAELMQFLINNYKVPKELTKTK